MRLLPSLLAAAAVTCAAADALACGGAFCSGGGGPPPLVQAGERVLFVADDKGDVEAHIQINFTGDPVDFAWVVPVPALPTLSVGSDQVFAVLDQATQPQFRLNVTGFCRDPFEVGCGGALPKSVADEAGALPNVAPGVTEVSASTVGPFDTKVITADDPAALENYLKDAKYDVTPAVHAVIAPYVEKKSYFVTLKLHPGRGTGDLQPIVVRYHSLEGPCVPIRMTAIATAPDLGVLVYVLGNARAVSTNYLNVIPNEARVQWLNGGQNWQQVVTEAVNEAGGHGFVTDFAGPSKTAADQLVQLRQSMPSHADYYATDTAPFVRAAVQAVQQFPSQNVLGILQRCVPLSGKPSPTMQDYFNVSSNFIGASPVKQPECGDDFQHLVIDPLQSAVDAANKWKTLTRLFTTLSAEEMTEDPIFVLNTDLPPVSNIHTADAKQVCDGSRAVGLEVTLPRQPAEPPFLDHTFTLETSSSTGAGPTGLTDGPFLLRAEEATAKGLPVVKVDNSEKVAASYLNSGKGCGCTSAPDLSLFGLAATLAALKLRRRR